MTPYTDASSETSNDNSKRNKKTQALSALLSATALGVFLEGCGGGDTPASTPAPAPAPTPAVLGSRSNPFVATDGKDTFTGKAGADWVSYAGSTAAGVTVDLGTPANNRGWAAGDTLTSIQNIIGSAQGDKLTGNGEPNVLRGGDGDDRLVGNAGDDTLDGGAGKDTLYSGEGDDTIYGGAGFDTINGGANDDTIDGGADDDFLQGNTGADTYIFRVGDGTDVITDEAGDTMTLRFEGSYIAADFTDTNNFNRVDNNLVITIDKTDDSITDKVTIRNAYNAVASTGTGNAAFTINIEYGSEGSETFAEVANSFWHNLGT